jgi:hypothetical protein
MRSGGDEARRRWAYALAGVIGAGALGALGWSEVRLGRELDALRASARSGAARPAGADGAATARGALSEADRLRRLELAVAAAAAASAAKPADEPPAEAAETRPAKRVPTLEEVQANVLTAYGREAGDPTWGPEASRKLEASLREALPRGSRLLSIDCRATMCLVEVEHPDERSAQAWLLPGFQDWPGSVLVAGERQEQGAVVQTLVPIRRGATPPYAGL